VRSPAPPFPHPLISPPPPLRPPSDARSVALSLLGHLELGKLEKLQGDQHASDRWRGQTIFKIPELALRSMLDDINTVVTAATECFAREETVLFMQQPCFVFGDIHGAVHYHKFSRPFETFIATFILFSPQEISMISSDLRACYGHWA